jgi:hypothetical protein
VEWPVKSRYRSTPVLQPLSACSLPAGNIASTSPGRGGVFHVKRPGWGLLGFPLSLTKPAVGGFQMKHLYGHSSGALQTQAYHSAALRLLRAVIDT